MRTIMWARNICVLDLAPIRILRLARNLRMDDRILAFCRSLVEYKKKFKATYQNKKRLKRAG